MSERKAAFAERTIRPSKTFCLATWRIMGTSIFINYLILLHNAKLNSRNNRSIDRKPNHVKNSDCMSILYSKPFREYKKPKYGIGDRVRISK